MLCKRAAALLGLRGRGLSTVEAGTAYEHAVASTFNRLGARLQRVGGAHDNGVDLRGSWALPGRPRFHMVGQCKHYGRKKIGPAVVREWEGVMSRQDTDTLGVIAASSGFTSSSVDAALSSAYPIAMVTVHVAEAPADAEDRAGTIHGFVWNRAAEPFIGRLVVAKKHFDIHQVDLADPAAFAIQLFWDGRPLPDECPDVPPSPESLCC
ncbi:hypothetical protein IWQ56_004899 [Coemansia nantahalensis]|nr:hypothetical protein IWQ56_004899 [Coemansia nantahalensis]